MLALDHTYAFGTNEELGAKSEKIIEEKKKVDKKLHEANSKNEVLKIENRKLKFETVFLRQELQKRIRVQNLLVKKYNDLIDKDRREKRKLITKAKNKSINVKEMIQKVEKRVFNNAEVSQNVSGKEPTLEPEVVIQEKSKESVEDKSYSDEEDIPLKKSTRKKRKLEDSSTKKPEQNCDKNEMSKRPKRGRGRPKRSDKSHSSNDAEVAISEIKQELPDDELKDIQGSSEVSLLKSD